VRRCLLLLILGVVIAGLCPSWAPADPGPLVLWYAKPARQWVDGMPLGNGRLGCMVLGKPEEERIQLNECTLWAAGPYDPSFPEALEALPEARRLIFAGKHREADRLIGRKMMARPIRQMPYQTAGDLLLTFEGHGQATDYRRELDLDAATARVTYRVGGVKFNREVFSSPVDQVIAIRLTADRPKSIRVAARLVSPQRVTVETVAPDVLVMNGVGGDCQGVKGAIRFQVRAKVLAEGGQVTAEKDRLTIRDADSATVLIAAATSYNNYQDASGDPDARAKKYLEGALGKPYPRLYQDHVAEHRRLFRRVELDLGATEAANRPTDERIKSLAKADDPQLAALYFQFGRYLLISCSRPGSQPATLQGLWTESLAPPWDSKYTININTEMNYWPAEPCNLAECTEPLIRMVGELVEPGSRTAKVNWGAGGWVCHHNTDIWRATAPIDGPAWGFWPTGGAWLCKHLWDHYEFSGDKQYLAQVYPVMKGAAQFFLDTLVEDPTHKWLVTCPSLSPENQHPGGVSVCAGPTMDVQILRDLFDHCVAAAEILGVDPEFRGQCRSTRKRLAPMQIGSQGQLQEWLEDWDAKAPEIQHRHVSHLYGLFPSDLITLRGAPELAAAARKSLEIRGDGGTGWSKAWKISLWARLENGDRAHKMLSELINTSTAPSMLDLCPPFQIDGNFGGAAGVAEMLLQSHAGQIALLPAWPKDLWKTGRVKGLRARGGLEVSIAWQDGRATSASLKATLDGRRKVRPPRGHQIAAIECDGKALPANASADGTVPIEVKAGRTYRLTLK